MPSYVFRDTIQKGEKVEKHGEKEQFTGEKNHDTIYDVSYKLVDYTVILKVNPDTKTENKLVACPSITLPA